MKRCSRCGITDNEPHTAFKADPRGRVRCQYAVQCERRRDRMKHPKEAKIDTTNDGACRRALAAAARFRQIYYVRRDAKGGYGVSDVRPESFVAQAVPSLHDATVADLRNMEMWPLPMPEQVS